MPEELPRNNVNETQPSPDGTPKTSEQPIQAQPLVPQTATSIKENNQKSSYHCEITCKTEKNWWEKTKPYLETVGAVLLLIYTIYTAKMYHSNKQAAQAAADSASEAKKSREQSEKAFGVTVEQFQMDQRAWISPHITNQLFEELKPFLIITEFNNTGKTPAIKVKTCEVAEIATLTRERKRFDLTCPEGAYSPGYDIIFPTDHIYRTPNAAGNGGKHTIYKDGLNRKPLMDALRHGKKILYVYGRVDYCDVFNRPHWVTFCSRFQVMPATPGGLPETKNWQTCEVGNDIDPVEPKQQTCHSEQRQN